MARVPIGRRNLFAERRRAVLGISGVAVTFLMILVLDGIVNGATRQLTRYDTSPASVFVAQRGVTNMHMASSSLLLADVDKIRALPGVSWADPILYAPDALATATGRQLTYVIGYPPTGRGGPVKLAAGRDPGTGQIVIDKRAAQNLRLGVGDSVRVLGRSWRISGLTSGLTNIANTVVFVPFEEFAAARSLQGTGSYILASKQGRSVVIVSHDSRLKEIADRVLWLEDGAFRSMSEMATDPVCGMAVEREGAPHYRHDGQTYFFCSTACREEFAASPDHFLRRPELIESPG